MFWRVIGCLEVLILFSFTACDQAPSAADIQAAAETITESDVSERVHFIADDAMGGRDTPSPGLDKTAAYIAEEFKRMGLEPLGDDGQWYQHFNIRVATIDPTETSVRLSAGDSLLELEPGEKTSGFSRGAPDQSLIEREIVVMGGSGEAVDPSLRGEFQDKVILWAASADFTREERQRVLAVAEAGGSTAVIIAVDDEERIRPVSTPMNVVGTDFTGPFWMTTRESRLREVLPALAEALDEVRSSEALSVVSDPGWIATFETALVDDQTHQVPNVVGLVRGRDPELQNEYLIYTAHFDHVGSRCAREDEEDRICNGADDNASGTTGLLELAEAFAQPEARPRRSVIFAAVSGEERGLLGSRYLAQSPPVPIDNVVANINMDHLGRNWTDSIVVIGGEHSDLGRIPAAVTEAHPELNMKPLPDQWPDENIYYRSDHYNFAREGVPILFFTNGFHDDYHRVTDSPDKIDAEKEARVVRYIFYIGREITDRDSRPLWDPESYSSIVRPERQTSE